MALPDIPSDTSNKKSSKKPDQNHFQNGRPSRNRNRNQNQSGTNLQNSTQMLNNRNQHHGQQFSRSSTQLQPGKIKLAKRPKTAEQSVKKSTSVTSHSSRTNEILNGPSQNQSQGFLPTPNVITRRPAPAVFSTLPPDIKRLMRENFLSITKTGEVFCAACNRKFFVSFHEGRGLEQLTTHIGGKNHKDHVLHHKFLESIKAIKIHPSYKELTSHLVAGLVEAKALTEEDRRERMTSFERLKKIVVEKFETANVFMYGSTVTFSGLKSSDINVWVDVKSKEHPLTVLSKHFQSDSSYKVTENFTDKYPSLSCVEISTNLNYRIATDGSFSTKSSWYIDLYNQHSPEFVKKICQIFRCLFANQLLLDDPEKGFLPPHVLNFMIIDYFQKSGVVPVLQLVDTTLADAEANQEEITDAMKTRSEDRRIQGWYIQQPGEIIEVDGENCIELPYIRNYKVLVRREDQISRKPGYNPDCPKLKKVGQKIYLKKMSTMPI